MNIYDLSRNFWDFAFENPDKIKPNHGAMYFFAIEHCNRLGWKDKFGFPTVMAMEAIGIKSYNTFINTLKELVEFGFIEMIEKSKNQYSANIIALSNFNEAHNKALDKALIKHSTKQSESTEQSTGESIDSINKQIYNTTNLPINNILLEKESKEENFKNEVPSEFFPKTETVKIEEKDPSKKVAQKKVPTPKEKFKPPSVQQVQDYCNERSNGISAYSFVNFYQSKGWKVGNQPMKDWKAAIRTWEQKNKENGNNNTSNNGFNNNKGNSGGSIKTSGKVSARTLLARRISGSSAGDSESGNTTIDIEAIE
ncbi:hypothetical protein [Chryseobacterium mucoviscidosis]|uniref:hypothetical protein n=1 Tax=Chryseobacterium mucoviscidosis TaxID=1945581 RepID=UPI00301AC8CD